MAGFRTHVTTSSVLGVGYAATGYLALEMPLPVCVLAGGLCGVSGMLPDLDSGSGIPLRESLALAAAVVPMLMIERFAQLGMSSESMVLAGALVYLLIRFGVGKFLRKYTVHRGMFHSWPAAMIAGLLAFLICQCPELEVRYYKAGSVVLGFMSHLILDELWSVDWRLGRWRLKSSFGTALKFYSPKDFWANVSTYAKLVLLTFLAVKDPGWMDSLQQQYGHDLPMVAERILEHLHKFK